MNDRVDYQGGEEDVMQTVFRLEDLGAGKARYRDMESAFEQMGENIDSLVFLRFVSVFREVLAVVYMLWVS